MRESVRDNIREMIKELGLQMEVISGRDVVFYRNELFAGLLAA
jgi:hypothetical protein